MPVLLFVSMVREYEGYSNAGVWVREGVVVVSARHECVGGTHGLCIVSSAADVLGMSGVRVTRGVGGVCKMCMFLAWGGVGGVDKRIGFGLYQSCGTGGVLDACLCLSCGGVCGIGGEWIGGFDQGLEGWVVLCLSEL